jgi:hypothetical protein
MICTILTGGVRLGTRSLMAALYQHASGILYSITNIANPKNVRSYLGGYCSSFIAVRGHYRTYSLHFVSSFSYSLNSQYLFLNSLATLDQP